MLIEPLQASRFIEGYKAVLLELHRRSGEQMHKDVIQNLASARSYLKKHPELLDEALDDVEMAGVSVALDVRQALKSLHIQQWVYLRSTTRYAVFLDSSGRSAYAVLGLTNPIETIVGRSAATFESGVFSFCGHYVCDGIVQGPVRLGLGYRKKFSADLATIKKQGQFFTVPDSTAS